MALERPYRCPHLTSQTERVALYIGLPSMPRPSFSSLLVLSAKREGRNSRFVSPPRCPGLSSLYAASWPPMSPARWQRSSAKRWSQFRNAEAEPWVSLGSLSEDVGELGSNNDSAGTVEGGRSASRQQARKSKTLRLRLSLPPEALLRSTR